MRKNMGCSLIPVDGRIPANHRLDGAKTRREYW